jgi:uncharacterized protein (TIRG00374 family)
MNRFIRPLARFVISFASITIILFLFREQLPAVLKQLTAADPWFFALAVIIFLAGLIAVAFRLQLVLKVHDADLSVINLYYMNLVALFFNNILPSHAGGEMVKAYYIYRGASNNVAAFSGVVIDRLFGIVTMIVIGLVAIMFFDQAMAAPKIFNSLIMLTVFTFGLFVVLFNKTIVDALCRVRLPLIPAGWLDKLRVIYQAMHYYRGQKTIVATGLLLTVVGQVAFVFTNYFLARSLAIDIPLGFFFYFVPIILILGLAPSVNGIGVREAAYLFYLTSFASADQALALSLFTSFYMVFVGIVGGILYAIKGGVPAMKDISDLRK